MKISKLVITTTLLLAAGLASGCQKQSQNSKSNSASISKPVTVKKNKEKQLQEKRNKFIYSGRLSAADKKQLAKMNITAFGDSVMEGCKDDYLALFPKMTVDAGVGRQAESLASELQNKNLPNTVLIGLGTNGPFSKEYYDQIMHTLGKRQVFWINTNVNKPWHDDVNSLLANGEKKYKNAHVINWDKYAGGNDDWFWDGIHPNIMGRKVMVNFVARNILAYEKYAN